MSLRRFLSRAVLAALPLAALGCDDGASPIDLGGLNAPAVTAAVDGLVAPLYASAEAIANLRGAEQVLLAAGLVPDPDAEEATPQLPPEVVGSTYVYDPSSLSWVTDESRTDAPTDGIRLIWYRLDSTGRVVEPLAEKGFIDVRPSASGEFDPVTTRIVGTEDGSTVLVDFSQGHDGPGNVVATQTLVASGSYSDGAETSTFSLRWERSENGVSNDVTDSYDMTIEQAGTRYVVDVNGSIDGSTGRSDDRVAATITRDGVSTGVDMNSVAVGQALEDATGTVTHAGVAVAEIRLNGNSYEFVAPNGDGIPAGQAGELNRLFGSLTLDWAVLFYDLPLYGFILE